MTIYKDLIDNLLKGVKEAGGFDWGERLTETIDKAVAGADVGGEDDGAFGVGKGRRSGSWSGNSRNGNSAKAIKGTFGTRPIEA